MPNYKGLTGDLELPDWPKNYDLKMQDGELDMLTVFTGDVIDAYQCGEIRVVDCIDVKSSAFSMICAGLFRYFALKNAYQSNDWSCDMSHANAWYAESAARLEAERKVG